MKEKIYDVPVIVNVSLKSVIEDLPDILQKDPKQGAKLMKQFGNNGDWSLELEYFKLIAKDLRIDFGKEAAEHMKAIVKIIETSY